MLLGGHAASRAAPCCRRCSARRTVRCRSALRAVLAFGLQEHLPLPAEAVELVHDRAAEERLQRLVDVAERDALLQHLVAVDVGVDLRHVRAERATSRRSARAACAPPRGTSAGCWSRNSTEPPLRSWSQNEKPPGVPRPGIAGGIERERRRLRDLRREAAVEAIDDRPRCSCGVRALVPGLERDEEEARCWWRSRASAG